MFLARLECGVLLFQTPQGLIPVELSFSQRLYLLWTFRNFRQLSPKLLNQRQVELVNTLAQNATGVGSNSYDRSLVIGVVEDFVMPPARLDAAIAVDEEEPEPEIMPEPEIALEPAPIGSPTSNFARLRSVAPRLATAAGTLVLCIMSLVAWHRIKAVPGSQAQDRPLPQQISPIAPPNVAQSAAPLSTSETPQAVVTPAATAPADTPPIVIPEATIKPASQTVAALIPKPPIRHRDAAAIPNIAPSLEARGIQATRPPLRFVYPTHSGVRTRGVVALTAEVDPQGSVRTVRVVSGNRALAAAAVHAVRQWRYRPYLNDGESVVTQTNVVISFFSDGAVSMSYPPHLPLTR